MEKIVKFASACVMEIFWDHPIGWSFASIGALLMNKMTVDSRLQLCLLLVCTLLGKLD